MRDARNEEIEWVESADLFDLVALRHACRRCPSRKSLGTDCWEADALAALPELFLAVLLRTESPASSAEGLVDTWKEMDERASWCGPLSTLVRPLWSFVLE